LISDNLIQIFKFFDIVFTQIPHFGGLMYVQPRQPAPLIKCFVHFYIFFNYTKLRH